MSAVQGPEAEAAKPSPRAREPGIAKANECIAMLAILDRMTIEGALVTIDAIATNTAMAKAITDKGADYLLALKRNQPSLHDDVAALFADLATPGLARCETIDKDHGRIETRTCTVASEIDWMDGDRRHPDERRFPGVASLVKSVTRTEWRGKTTSETRYFIASAVLTPERAVAAIRSHWTIESMHWVLDVIFKEDQSRLRRGHGARNMAMVRRFSFNLVRAGRGKTSIKTTRKAAGWNPNVLEAILSPKTR